MAFPFLWRPFETPKRVPSLKQQREGRVFDLRSKMKTSREFGKIDTVTYPSPVDSSWVILRRPLQNGDPKCWDSQLSRKPMVPFVLDSTDTHVFQWVSRPMTWSHWEARLDIGNQVM